MDFSNVPVYLVTDEKQRLYCTGFHSTAGYVILTEDKTRFVVDSRYFYAAEKRLSPKGIEVFCSGDYSVLKEVIATVGAERMGVDFGLTTVKQLEELKALGVEVVNVASQLQNAMSVKTDEEVRLVAKACAIAEKSFKEVISCVKEGVSEREVATELEYRFRKNGASGCSFDTIVAFGANSAVPHHETGETKLKQGMPVLMDFGCVYKGYCSDMTRTFYFGTPTRQFVSAYGAVLSSHVKAYENARAGMTGREIDGIARASLEADGLGEYFTHSLGHGIGVNVHEAPWVSPRAENTVEDGMIFSIEPGVYLNGKFGIRIEDSVIMQGGKPQSFMKLPKYLQTVKNGKLVKYTGKGK